MRRLLEPEQFTSVRFTERLEEIGARYQHVIPGMQADAARLFCEALCGERAT